MIYPHPAIQLLDLLPVLFGRFITEKDANQRPFDSKIQWFRSLGEQQASPFILPPPISHLLKEQLPKMGL
ncbi:hypothetical protein PALA30_03944 [Pseudomonas aeruginosa]|uniref:hypothetical protein n=1 Tax=Pseudomonas aeruginosa TaxID=287 RepID=UPI0003B9CD56|nr:hypothetical protein [Pseudomonas aeruginosa]ERY12131.1 hypothetical protein Q076_02662 [Pseudomonas aeruginosa BL22]EZO48651.1 hypothetical protein V561_01160 [Pseudomonas aeruginosa BWH060]EZO95373.1 hypothetical protein V554_03083 [Pseudomonas aeruginosa BWH053]MBL7580140.1 hypothetical protein [Pseudomonas aeruginosa]WBI57200.1 hypothetical protein PALA30_03944 [Pseudomonas aeruginosa]